jgi:hypothetical protein
MALAIDASSPAVVQNTNATTSTTSFTPPANASYVAFAEADAGTGAADETLTVNSTGGLSWSRAVEHNGSPGAVAEVWVATSDTAPGSITVSVTDNKGAVAKRLFVRVFTDSNGFTPAGVGATNSGTTGTVAYTSTVADSWGWACAIGSGTPNAGSGQTLQDSASGTGPDGDSAETWRQDATTGTPGTSVSMSSTMSSLHTVAVEVLPGVATGPPEVGVPQGVLRKVPRARRIRR